MLDAPNMLGSVSFQSNDVKGAQNSEFLLYEKQEQHITV